MNKPTNEREFFVDLSDIACRTDAKGNLAYRIIAEYADNDTGKSLIEVAEEHGWFRMLRLHPCAELKFSYSTEGDLILQALADYAIKTQGIDDDTVEFIMLRTRIEKNEVHFDLTLKGALNERGQSIAKPVDADTFKRRLASMTRPSDCNAKKPPF